MKKKWLGCVLTVENARGYETGTSEEIFAEDVSFTCLLL
jgi:hypothetical protein